jgi:hypothetical protein
MGRSPKNDLGIVAPPRGKGELISIRLQPHLARKLEVFAKQIGVGRSTMGRLILEKFIAEHDPDRKGKR